MIGWRLPIALNICMGTQDVAGRAWVVIAVETTPCGQVLLRHVSIPLSLSESPA